MKESSSKDRKFSNKETVERRDAALVAALKMPPAPRKPIGNKKPGTKKK